MAERSKAQQKAYAKVIDYQKVFGSPAGQKVLQDLMAHNFVLSSTANGDPNVSIEFNEGQRNSVLRILKILKIDPSKMFDLMDKADKQESALDWT